MNGRQQVAIWIVAMLLVAATITTIAVLGFREAAGNRRKDQKMFTDCIASGQPALTCKAAIHGSG